MNSVQLIGRLTSNPKFTYAPNGTALATFRLAVDRSGDGAEFVTVKAWDRLAKRSAEHLTRGRRVAVQGRLEHSEWTDPEGRRAERLTVVADRIEFLDRPTRRKREPSPSQQPPEAAPGPSVPAAR